MKKNGFHRMPSHREAARQCSRNEETAHPHRNAATRNRYRLMLREARPFSLLLLRQQAPSSSRSQMQTDITVTNRRREAWPGGGTPPAPYSGRYSAYKDDIRKPRSGFRLRIRLPDTARDDRNGSHPVSGSPAGRGAPSSASRDRVPAPIRKKAARRPPSFP